jgi:hypothetical protein
VRREATGYGAVYFVGRMLATRGQDVEGRRVVVSGSGNVAIYTMEKVQQSGGTVVACSESGGYVVDEGFIDLDLVKDIKEVRRERISAYVRRRLVSWSLGVAVGLSLRPRGSQRRREATSTGEVARSRLIVWSSCSLLKGLTITAVSWKGPGSPLRP